MANPATENNVVARQYEKWMYPFPIPDLSAPEVRGKRDGGDFLRNYHTFWPDQEPREDLDVLIAGCGSNAAARYAFNHPKARVVGIDLSSSSLAHEAYLKEKHQLTNLSLHQGRIEDVAAIGQDFDFIDCSGVLHHLPDPVAGLCALGGVLRPNGTIAIMVYGRHARAGVYMLQEMFRLMGLGQTEADVATVKQTLAALPKRHIIQDYLGRTHDIKYDAGIVDTFLHRQDRAYTVTECLEFARAAGMAFMGWWDNILYYAEGQLAANGDLFRKVNSLAEPSIWQFMELYNGTLGQHSFCACHPARPERGYKVEFSTGAFMDYIPVRRCREVASPAGTPEGALTVQRPTFPPYTLAPSVAALFRQIDGKKSVRECLAGAKLASADAKNADEFCRAAFRYLWRLSNIFLRIPA